MLEAETEGQVKPARESLKKSGKEMSAREKALLCARVGAEYKALDLVVLEVSPFTSFADYFIIASGKSSRQVQGIADNLEKNLREHGIKPLGVEGRGEGQWVLMDYGDVILHIFYEPIRHFYDLESLWSEAARIPWEQDLQS